MSRQTDETDEGALWRSALDTFAEGLVSARQALAADQEAGAAGASAGETAAASWPPKALPTSPIPPHLEAEARALLAESDELTKALLDGMDRNRVPARRSTPRGGAGNHARWSLQL